MALVNVDQICEVRLLGKTRNTIYEYMEEDNSWLFGKRHAGYYSMLDIGCKNRLTAADIESAGEMVIIDRKVFYRPRIYIKMSNGDVRYKYFDTIEQVRDYFKSAPEFANIRWAEGFDE